MAKLPFADRFLKKPHLLFALFGDRDGSVQNSVYVFVPLGGHGAVSGIKRVGLELIASVGGRGRLIFDLVN